MNHSRSNREGDGEKENRPGPRSPSKLRVCLSIEGAKMKDLLEPDERGVFRKRESRTLSERDDCCIPYLRADAINAIRVQHILERHDAFEFMNVRPLDDRQDVKMVRAHAFQSQMQGMIHVDMGKMKRLDNLPERLLFSPIDQGALQCLSGQHAQKVLLIRHRPDAELTEIGRASC